MIIDRNPNTIVCIEFHDPPSNVCWDLSVWTNCKNEAQVRPYFFLSFLVGPAPVLSPTRFSPLRREVHSGPLKRSWGRRQRRDITPPTPTSTRTLNCSASSQQLSQPSASWTHTCTDYSHTHHSIMFCTKILLLALNWPLLDKNGVGGAFFLLQGS